MKHNGHRAKTYTKRDIVRKVAAAGSENMNVSARWTEMVFTAVREIMMSADPELRIEIRDFGVFEVKPTKSKPKARNPKSGEIICRSEEHTSELQSLAYLVCRLLLDKK